MNTLTKLAVAALGAAGVAGGVALAQETQSTYSSKDPNADPNSANYGTPPGAPLKRDGSLRADQASAPMASPATTDSSSSTTTTTTTTSTTPAAEPAPAATPAAPADISPPPRADRN
jgi:cytoskeletal protein RodZ